MAHLDVDVPRHRVDVDLLGREAQLGDHLAAQRARVARDLLDRRQLLRAARLGKVVHGQVVRRRARHEVAERLARGRGLRRRGRFGWGGGGCFGGGGGGGCRE